MDAKIPSSQVAAAFTDPRGRFYGGTLFKQYCSASNEFILSFYRFDNANGLTRLFSGLKVSVGIAFNENARKMYHLTPCQLKIVEFDWDPQTGDICNFDFFLQFWLFLQFNDIETFKDMKNVTFFQATDVSHSISKRKALLYLRLFHLNLRSIRMDCCTPWFRMVRFGWSIHGIHCFIFHYFYFINHFQTSILYSKSISSVFCLNKKIKSILVH